MRIPTRSSKPIRCFLLTYRNFEILHGIKIPWSQVKLWKSPISNSNRVNSLTVRRDNFAFAPRVSPRFLRNGLTRLAGIDTKHYGWPFFFWVRWKFQTSNSSRQKVMALRPRRCAFSLKPTRSSKSRETRRLFPRVATWNFEIRREATNRVTSRERNLKARDFQF